MRGGKIVILVFLAPDKNKSSQGIGMLYAMKNHGSKDQEEEHDDHTASDDPRVSRWLPMLGNKETGKKKK